MPGWKGVQVNDKKIILVCVFHTDQINNNAGSITA